MRTFIIHAISIILVIVPMVDSFVSGPLDGLKCDSETVQLANSAQLNSILAELTDTTFFRLVRVDGHGYCPIESLRPKAAADEATCGAVLETFSSAFAPSGNLAPPDSLCSIQPEVSALEVAELVVTAQSPEEVSAQHEFPRDNDCMVEGTLQIRPDYWLDICDGHSGGREYVNLKLNPERNTGYDGSAVWAEMHASAAALGESLEGRILQKLLSGYHTSVSTHIMWSYFPGSDGSWRPNFKKAANVLTDSRVKDMQFAFVVMARALFKIKDWLYEYPFTTGNVTADLETANLMNHLLDTSVLAVCGSVLSGFDESSMFSHSPTVSPSNLGIAASDFKKAFRRISRLVNCVTCHRCKLHATVAMHGIGAAIKILLTPDEELVTTSLSRDDLVALVNTVETLSEGIQLASKLMVSGGSQLKAKALATVRAAELTRLEEDALVAAILADNPKVMELAKIDDGKFFLRHSLISLGVVLPDAVVVGGGLAGLVTAISIADRGGAVVILEKESRVGGNSAKASSGINKLENVPDSSFLKDTVKSQGNSGDRILAENLVTKSAEAVAWLEKISNVNLTAVGRLGGHSTARTWRPELGLVGSELMAALAREVKKRPEIQLVLNAKVTKLTLDKDQVSVEYESEGIFTIHARNVVISSGGFGYDTTGLLLAHRPDLVGFPTTLGPHTTGDGIRLGVALGADLIDMEYVQLHPTGFVDPQDPQAHTKVLAAELLRGVGGMLLTMEGKRFVNELGTRKEVVDAMLATGGREFWLVLSEHAAMQAQKLTTMYMNRGLLVNVTNEQELIHLLGVPQIEGLSSKRFENYWLVGKVTPVVHYTMGGLRVDPHGRLLRADKSLVPNVFAAGEVAGGVHGQNRLGGNSLLECVVFGREIGTHIAIKHELTPSGFHHHVEADNRRPVPPLLSLEAVERHTEPSDCWTVIGTNVYDLSGYANEHPGGAAAITESCGRNSTNRFLGVHTLSLLKDMDFFPVGYL